MKKNDIIISLNSISLEKLVVYLQSTSNLFSPPLSERVCISDYARKLFLNAILIEAWSGENLVGLLAYYCNDKINHQIFITNVSVISEFQKQGIAKMMFDVFFSLLPNDFLLIRLEVDKQNQKAINLYNKYGFSFISENIHTFNMVKYI